MSDSAGSDSLALERQLCLDLSSAARAVVSLYRPLLEPHGLTHPQYLVLAALWQYGELTVKRLGEALHLDSGTLSPLLKRLDAAGLVRRARALTDERSVLVSLTDDGDRLRGEAISVHEGVLNALRVDDDDLAHLHSRLTRITTAGRKSS